MIGSKLFAAGLVLVIGLAFGWHLYDRGRAYNEGRIAERLEWQEQRAADLAAAEADRKRAADRIADIERKYLSTKQEAAIEIADLERALAEEKADAAKLDPNGACYPGPAVSRRVRDELQKLGHR